MTQRPDPFRSVAPFRALTEHTHVSSVAFLDEDTPSELTVGLVVGTESALLVDAGSTPEQGRLLAAAAGRVTSVPVTTVVLTHAHVDHAYGIVGVGADTVLAHEAARDELGADPDAPALPDRTVAVAAAVDLGGGVRVEIVHLGRGHTAGDLVVVVPSDDAVFAGDLVESAGPPQLGPDSYAHDWPATLDGLIGLTTDRSVVVPGHGPVMTRQDVFEQRGRLAAVSGEISRLAGLGTGVDDAESRGDWALPFVAVRAGYAAACRQARAAEPVRRLPVL